jgi:hypothetical protein
MLGGRDDQVGGTGLATPGPMARRKPAPRAGLTEVLDRVLDRGIVVDAWLCVSVAGIELLDVDARVVVASISTEVREAGAVASPGGPRPPAVAPAATASRRRRRVTLRCARGCTFIRAAARRPASVRCPAGPGLTCPVDAPTAPA